KGEGSHPRDSDAHQARRVRVLRRCLQLLAKLCTFKKPVQERHHGGGDGNEDEILRVKRYAGYVNGRGAENVRQLIGEGAVNNPEKLFNEGRRTDCRDHHRQESAWTIANRLVNQKLEKGAATGGKKNRQNDGKP